MKAERCPNCNAPVRPNQLKCDYCGTWFDVPDVERIILYADNQPFEIVEKVNDWITNDVNRNNLSDSITSK